MVTQSIPRKLKILFAVIIFVMMIGSYWYVFHHRPDVIQIGHKLVNSGCRGHGQYIKIASESDPFNSVYIYNSDCELSIHGVKDGVCSTRMEWISDWPLLHPRKAHAVVLILNQKLFAAASAKRTNGHPNPPLPRVFDLNDQEIESVEALKHIVLGNYENIRGDAIQQGWHSGVVKEKLDTMFSLFLENKRVWGDMKYEFYNAGETYDVEPVAMTNQDDQE